MGLVALELLEDREPLLSLDLPLLLQADLSELPKVLLDELLRLRQVHVPPLVLGLGEHRLSSRCGHTLHGHLLLVVTGGSWSVRY